MNQQPPVCDNSTSPVITYASCENQDWCQTELRLNASEFENLQTRRWKHPLCNNKPLQNSHLPKWGFYESWLPTTHENLFCIKDKKVVRGEMMGENSMVVGPYNLNHPSNPFNMLYLQDKKCVSYLFWHLVLLSCFFVVNYLLYGKHNLYINPIIYGVY